MSNQLPPPEALFDYTDYVGNHERKMLLGAIMLANADTVFDAGSLARDYRDYQHPEMVWKLGRPDCGDFLERCLVPGGVAEETKSSGEYRAAPGGVDLLAAATSIIMRWSLEYKDLSVQQILGGSNATGSVRSPRARLRIYDHLLRHEGVRLFHLEALSGRIGYKKPECVSRQVEAMEDLGIVEIEIPEYNPLIRIIPTTRNDISREITEQIRDLAETLPPGTQLLLDDFLGRFKHRMSAEGLVEARRAVVGALNHRNSTGKFAGLELIDDTVNTKAAYVKLSGEVKAPVEDLRDSLWKLGEEGPTRKLIRDMHTVLNQPGHEDFRTLVAKARAFSGAAARDSATELHQKIISLMPQGTKETVSVRELRTNLQKKYGKVMTVIALRTVMNRMAGDGLLVRRQVHRESRIVESPFKDKDTRVTNVYQLPVEAKKPKKRQPR